MPSPITSIISIMLLIVSFRYFYNNYHESLSIGKMILVQEDSCFVHVWPMCWYPPQYSGARATELAAGSRGGAVISALGHAI